MDLLSPDKRALRLPHPVRPGRGSKRGARRPRGGGETRGGVFKGVRIWRDEYHHILLHHSHEYVEKYKPTEEQVHMYQVPARNSHTN